MKRIVSLAAVFALITVLFTGCAEKESKLTTVRLCEVAHSIFYAPQYAAMQLGFFEEEGLQLELTNGGGADKVMTSVLSGQADIGLAGPEACIYVALEGREDGVKVFAQLTKRDGAFLVGREKVESFDWSQLAGSTVIGGRKGGVPEMTLEYVLRKNGLEPGEDLEVDTTVAFNMMAGAFTGGTGDYVALFEPTATEVELAGNGYVLCSIGQESGEIPYTAYFAAESYLEGQSDVVQRFTKVIARAQEWVRTHTPEEIAANLTEAFPDSSMEVLTAVARRYQEIDAWNATPEMKEEALLRLQEVMMQAGELEESVAYDMIVDMRFVEKLG